MQLRLWPWTSPFLSPDFSSSKEWVIVPDDLADHSQTQKFQEVQNLVTKGPNFFHQLLL